MKPPVIEWLERLTMKSDRKIFLYRLAFVTQPPMRQRIALLTHRGRGQSVWLPRSPEQQSFGVPDIRRSKQNMKNEPLPRRTPQIFRATLERIPTTDLRIFPTETSFFRTQQIAEVFLSILNLVWG